MSRKKSTAGGIIIVLILLAGYFALRFFVSPTESSNPINEAYVLERTEKNYGAEIDALASDYDLSSAYLKALIVLECSGRKKVKPRFEQKVFDHLKKVRDKESKNYGSITFETIGDASDDALRNLATSWGPFQLMGYQCIEMGVNVKDIRGEESLKWGVIWINKRYGKRLRKERFKDAFHIHNTGRPYPKIGGPRTHDPSYVDRGLKYIEFFSN